MRNDTDYGPVWIFPDMLPKKAARHGARLDLMWPDLEGFTAMHTGPSTGGAWLVRAPKAALEARGLLTGSASEHPVAEGTVWPPLPESTVKLLKWEYETLTLMFGEEVAQAWAKERVKKGS